MEVISKNTNITGIKGRIINRGEIAKWSIKGCPPYVETEITGGPYKGHKIKVPSCYEGWVKTDGLFELGEEVELELNINKSNTQFLRCSGIICKPESVTDKVYFRTHTL